MNNSKSIIIIEDEALTAMYLKMALSTAGYKIEKVYATGEEIIKKIDKITPDLIIMDINLAGKINGIETYEKITEKFFIPVIFITGYSEKIIIDKVIKLKPIGFLVKPVKINELKNLINNFFLKN